MFPRLRKWWADRGTFVCITCQRKLEKQYYGLDKNCAWCYQEDFTKRYYAAKAEQEEKARIVAHAEQRKLVDAFKIAIREVEAEKECSH